jgi:hypothetical protein
MHRAKYLASALFFVGYVIFHAVYPLLEWIDPERNTFTWSMYSGSNPRPLAVVVFDDGSTRAIPDPLYSGRAPRVLSSAVDLWRFFPRHLCGQVENAREITLTRQSPYRVEVTRCPSPPAD